MFLTITGRERFGISFSNRLCQFLSYNCNARLKYFDWDRIRKFHHCRSQIFPITATGDPLTVTVNVTILAFPEVIFLNKFFEFDLLYKLRFCLFRCRDETLSYVAGIPVCCIYLEGA